MDIVNEIIEEVLKFKEDDNKKIYETIENEILTKDNEYIETYCKNI